MKITTTTKTKDGEEYTSIQETEKVEITKNEIVFYFRHKGSLIPSSKSKLRHIIKITIEDKEQDQ